MTTTDLLIVGAGGLGREALQVALDEDEGGRRWNVIGFVDDSPNRPPSVHELPVVGGVDALERYPSASVHVAIGNSAARKRVVESVRASFRNRFATLTHPLCWIGRRVEVGAGSMICAGARLSTDIRLGSHCVVNLNATIGHDAVLGDYVTLSPSVNVSGHVQLGEGCEIGTCVGLVPFATVGAWSIVGAGATVVHSIGSRVTAVGTPARAIVR